jgi:hypothetical protein
VLVWRRVFLIVAKVLTLIREKHEQRIGKLMKELYRAIKSMKKFFLLSAMAILVFLASPAKAQVTQSGSLSASNFDVIKLGKRTITIPAPIRLVNAMPNFPKITGGLRAATPANSEHLLGYVASGLKDDEFSDVNLFATVQISKANQTSDIQPELFETISVSMEKQEGMLFEPNSRLVQEAIDQRLRLNSNGNPTTNIPRIVKFGVFDKSPNVFGTVFLLRTENFGRSADLIGAGSFIYISHRIVYVGVYKRLDDAKDVAFVQSLAKEWNDQIVNANK